MPLCNASRWGQTGKEVLGYCGSSSFSSSLQKRHKNMSVWIIVGWKNNSRNKHFWSFFKNKKNTDTSFEFFDQLVQSSVKMRPFTIFQSPQKSSRVIGCEVISSRCLFIKCFSLLWTTDQWVCNNTICFHFIYFH